MGNQIGDGLRSSDDLWVHPDPGGLCNGLIRVHGGALRRGALVELAGRATFWLEDLGEDLSPGLCSQLARMLWKGN